MKNKPLQEILLPTEAFIERMRIEVAHQLKVYNFQKTITPCLTMLEVEKLEQKGRKKEMKLSIVHCALVGNDNEDIIPYRDNILLGIGYDIGVEQKFILAIFFTAQGTVNKKGKSVKQLVTLGMTTDGRQAICLTDTKTGDFELMHPKDEYKDNPKENEVAVLNNFFDGYKKGIAGEPAPLPDFESITTEGTTKKLDSIN